MQFEDKTSGSPRARQSHEDVRRLRFAKSFVHELHARPDDPVGRGLTRIILDRESLTEFERLQNLKVPRKIFNVGEFLLTRIILTPTSSGTIPELAKGKNWCQ